MVPKRLKEAREARGLSQQKLAELVEIDGFDIRKRISNYEVGRYSPSYQIAVSIAKALNYPECYFYIQSDVFAEMVLHLYKNESDSHVNPYFHSLVHAQKLVSELNDFLKKTTKK